MIIQTMVCYYIIINIVAFILYGIDKLRAIKGKWRISEKTLLGIAWLGGGPGAYFGMQIYRHKTKHRIFRIMIPLSVLAHAIMVIMLILEVKGF